MILKDKTTWQIDVNTKFVFYVDKFNYIKRVQMLNRSGWGYLDLKKKDVGKITVQEFRDLYSTYHLPDNVWLIQSLSVHSF